MWLESHLCFTAWFVVYHGGTVAAGDEECSLCGHTNDSGYDREGDAEVAYCRAYDNKDEMENTTVDGIVHRVILDFVFGNGVNSSSSQESQVLFLSF